MILCDSCGKPFLALTSDPAPKLCYACADAPRFLAFFDTFTAELKARLQRGYDDYGDGSFERPLPDLAREIEQEILDICGWSVVLLARLRALSRALADVERARCGPAKHSTLTIDERSV